MLSAAGQIDAHGRLRGCRLELTLRQGPRYVFVVGVHAEGEDKTMRTAVGRGGSATQGPEKKVKRKMDSADPENALPTLAGHAVSCHCVRESQPGGLRARK